MNMLLRILPIAFGIYWNVSHIRDVMETDQLHSLVRSAESIIGLWWQDDRRNWCAYCGIPMRRRAATGTRLPPTKATRDHVVPRVHASGLLTLPCCLECNQAKGKQSLPEFLSGPYFNQKRMKKHRNQWPLAHLWFVAGLAYFRKSELIAQKARGSRRVAG
ncbi:MAG: HNH endonuclease [Nitratireductor sp.]|uniref:hypothetical protein n=1 Tax=Nitratireductor sp. TaxID=1872084 RepID=UPI0026268D43|nr:hypothetical protein [Nitratireductor sp.]MCV0352360.1 HNH endonuclease [Nitratireductor sp.]